MGDQQPPTAVTAALICTDRAGLTLTETGLCGAAPAGAAVAGSSVPERDAAAAPADGGCA